MITDEKENLLSINVSGYEGPLDLLIDLSKKQKVDITKVSIFELAEQYLKFINNNIHRLNLSADYLVMASFLAFLKSKMLLPDDENNTISHVEGDLAKRLAHYSAIKAATKKLENLPRLGEDFFIRKLKSEFYISNKTVINASLNDLFDNYLSIYKKQEKISLQFKKNRYFSIEDGMKWMKSIYLLKDKEWKEIFDFLPLKINDLKMKKSAIMSLILATLTMAKEGKLDIIQKSVYDKIFVKLKDKNEI